MPQKTVEKIRRWEYMDLATLLSNDPPTGEPSTITVSGQTLIVNPPGHQSKKQKVTLDMHFWVQASSAYAAALTSAEETSKPESAGLLGHICIMSCNWLEIWEETNGFSTTRHSKSGWQLKK